MPEFEDFLRIGDEASRMVQEQKSKARILQSLLAAEDTEEAERKVLETSKLVGMEEKAAPETEDIPNADQIIQAIKNNCDGCIEQAINHVFHFSEYCFENDLHGLPLLFQSMEVNFDRHATHICHACNAIINFYECMQRIDMVPPAGRG
ncbi:hypothetical protein JCGZ_03675 [Jatropha curcas]|uniref:Uncharacterized protein n=1 Tax=Jatropha curcas TaxID=180498 RepID=A0A067KWM8_JATCU|nr:hypothetical protein JCGZ_03675 [Jatropha curcas]